MLSLVTQFVVPWPSSQQWHLNCVSCVSGSNGPQLFTIEQWGTPDKLPRAHTWYVPMRHCSPVPLLSCNVLVNPSLSFCFPVSTAWICPAMNHSRTWERNSSWLWRTLKASRGSTKTNWTQQQIKQTLKPQGLKPAAVAVLFEHVVL